MSEPLLESAAAERSDPVPSGVLAWLASTQPKASVVHGRGVAGSQGLGLLAAFAFFVFASVQLYSGWRDLAFATSFEAVDEVRFPAVAVTFLNYSDPGAPLSPAVTMAFYKGDQDNSCLEQPRPVNVSGAMFFFANVGRNCSGLGDGSDYIISVDGVYCDSRLAFEAIIHLGFGSAKQYADDGAATLLTTTMRPGRDPFVSERVLYAPAVNAIYQYELSASRVTFVDGREPLSYGAAALVGAFTVSECNGQFGRSYFHLRYPTMTVSRLHQYRSRDLTFLIAAVGGALSLLRIYFSAVSFVVDRRIKKAA